MQSTEDMMQDLIDKRIRLNELKAQSEEIAEAIKLAEEYQMLFRDLIERCKEATPNIVPMPYPVYPSWPFINITTAPTTKPMEQYKFTCISSGF